MYIDFSTKPKSFKRVLLNFFILLSHMTQFDIDFNVD